MATNKRFGPERRETLLPVLQKGFSKGRLCRAASERVRFAPRASITSTNVMGRLSSAAWFRWWGRKTDIFRRLIVIDMINRKLISSILSPPFNRPNFRLAHGITKCDTAQGAREWVRAPGGHYQALACSDILLLIPSRARLRH